MALFINKHKSEEIRKLMGQPVDTGMFFQHSKVYHMPISSLQLFDKFYPIVTWNGREITQQEINRYSLPKGYSTYSEAYKALEKIKFDTFDNGICVYDGNEWLRINEVDYRNNIIVVREVS